MSSGYSWSHGVDPVVTRKHDGAVLGTMWRMFSGYRYRVVGETASVLVPTDDKREGFRRLAEAYDKAYPDGLRSQQCPRCGRFLSASWSTGHSDGVRDWENGGGTCSVHGPQEWSGR